MKIEKFPMDVLNILMEGNLWHSIPSCPKLIETGVCFSRKNSYNFKYLNFNMKTKI